MAALLAQFIPLVGECLTSGSAAKLLSLIPLEPKHPFFGPLQQATQSLPLASLEASTVVQQLGTVHNEHREQVSGFLSSLLIYVRGVPDPGFAGAYADFQNLITLYTESNRILALVSPSTSSSTPSPVYPHISQIVLHLARILLSVSRQVAAMSNEGLRSNRSSRAIRDTTRQVIERSMQICCANVPTSDWDEGLNRECMVGDVIWGLSGVLWRIYAERKLHSQATELDRTISALQPHEEKRLASRGSRIPAAEVCQSWYWRGRIFVILLNTRRAKHWLDKAWSACPTNASQQRRAILIKLIPVNLLLGVLPSRQLMQRYDLQQYMPLIHAFRTGNIPAWRQELERNREWYRSRSVWLLLYERGEILVWRNLCRRSLREWYILVPDAPKGRCPSWVFLAAIKQAFEGSGEVEEGDVRKEDVIVTLSSLIDQSLILGNLAYSQQQLVMKPSPDGFGGFPKLLTVVPRAIMANV